jgi:hypothetical protein
MNVRTMLTLGSLALALAGALVGCADGPSDDGPRVASAREPATPTGGGTAPATGDSNYDKALRFARCMNDNGEKVPDPVEGQPLQIAAPNEQGFAIVPSPAFEKCRALLPPSWPVKADPKHIAQGRAWGECMRSHGVETPELTPDANGMVQTQPDPTLVYTPEWRAAEAACRHVGNPNGIPLTDG